ncbi:uncharacterized protein LOC127286539 isoform X7 [Leptopilina boulardi]|uniref:uncharacterized protein LOC127286539 isoform X4 n=1 Tax=Leptopilina boulardi TaxID=63433 RepID=UPI0021F642D5|nr:uncharacterized protein LOC127286539 isoform X4 [Leptopilina boulardi]XP_051168948.1 uncharacterized protein LOC127286539 isoform X7 [Leptopilina boulardi]
MCFLKFLVLLPFCILVVVNCSPTNINSKTNNELSSEDVSMQQNSDEMQPEMRFISNYALDSSFSIPLIVKRCIQEVENRGMNEPLLYFEISYEENGKKLFTELTNNHVDLSQQNPLIIAETLKFFLRFLKSPLIVPELINEFSQAVESTVDFEKLKELINKLPLVNRRTLALLMTHLKRVLKQNHVSQMQLNIIFKHLFFYCYASPNIAGNILDAFFSFPFKYWNLITNYTSIIKIRQEENSAINTEDDMRNEVIHVLTSEDETMQQNSDEMQPDKLRIHQYSLDSSSSIPIIIIRSIQELENRGINNIQNTYYYTRNRNVNENNLLKEIILSNNVDLSQYDPLIFPKIIKTFLSDLKSPLIAFQFSKKLSQAVKSTVDFEKLKELIDKLPLVNRKTLALLMIHLKRVLKNENSVLQSRLNLYYRKAFFFTNISADNQKKIIDAFFSLPFDYWNSITDYASVIHVLSSGDETMQQNSDERQPDKLYIEDYPLNSSIPLIIIRSIQELENRGINNIQNSYYYSRNTNVNENNLLKEMILSDNVDLSQYDPLIFPKIIKTFLSDLRSPLIVSRMNKNLSQAVKSTVDFEKLKELIDKLPLVNRKTLALLMIHLKRVLKNENSVLQSRINLYYRNAAFSKHLPIDKQEKIFDAFFSLPSDYWNSITDYDTVIHVLSSQDETMQQNSDEREPQKLYIEDYPLNSSIPLIIIRSIQELENRGINNIQNSYYYSRNTNVNENNLLKEMILSDNVDLSQYDPLIFPKIIKTFLSDLKSPLIVSRMNKNLSQIVESTVDFKKLKELIDKLPLVNRKTLALLMIHLKRVLKNENSVLQSRINLYYRKAAFSEHLPVDKQEKIFDAFFSLPSDYWNSITDYDTVIHVLSSQDETMQQNSDEREPQKLYIEDYPLNSSIPLIIIRSIQELENRGINNIQNSYYYSRNTNVNENNLLKEMILSDNVDLSQYDPLIFPKIIKTFLSDLKSPLIVSRMNKNLSQIVESTVDFKKLKELIDKLPLVNRKTLALLMIHSKRVLKNKKSVLQSRLNLYYRKAFFFTNISADNQKKIVDAFFSLPFDYWNSITDYASVIHVLSSGDETMQQNSDEREPQKLYIEDYPLNSSIPLIIIRSIQELENRGINNIQNSYYYSRNTNVNENNLLKEMILSDNVDLSQYDPLIFPKIIKTFLSDLKSPLIVSRMNKNLSQIVESTVDFKKLKELIDKLPLVNRKTLALLMIHLKRVLKNENSVLQSRINLYYRKAAFSEHLPVDKQEKIFDAFFSLPSDYWNSITDYDTVIHLLSAEDETMQQNSDEREPQKLYIEDYPLNSSIPLIIIRSIKELEKRGINYIQNSYNYSKYRNVNDYNLLKEMLLSDNVDLSQYNSLILPKIIRIFLRDLKSPLIAFQFSKKLSQAVKSTVDFEKLKELIDKLPLVNRKTLALLMIHLKRVLKNENSVLQSRLNLYYRKAFFFTSISADNQKKIIDAFFSLPFDYWNSITDYASVINGL